MRPQFKILVITGTMLTAGLGAAVPAGAATAAPVMDTSVFACSGSVCEVGPGNVGMPFAAGLNVTGDGVSGKEFGDFFRMAIISGSLPPGLQLSLPSSEWTVTGTPTRAGTYPFTVQFTPTQDIAPNGGPSGTQQLASVESPPLNVMLKLMDVPSDDFFAEMLTKQLGVRFGSAGSITAGAQVISQQIDGLGLHPQIVDGSGLSRSDRSSPGEVVDLLKTVWNTPNGRILAASLPTVGMNGTVQNIAEHTAAQGHCIAKTGTLNYVTNLAGYCTARDNHVLAFALMIDGPGNWTAIQLFDQMVPALAKY